MCNEFQNSVIDVRETDLYHEFSGDLDHEIISAELKLLVL